MIKVSELLCKLVQTSHYNDAKEEKGREGDFRKKSCKTTYMGLGRRKGKEGTQQNSLPILFFSKLMCSIASMI